MGGEERLEEHLQRTINHITSYIHEKDIYCTTYERREYLLRGIDYLLYAYEGAYEYGFYEGWDSCGLDRAHEILEPRNKTSKPE